MIIMRVYITVSRWANEETLKRLKEKCEVVINPSSRCPTKEELKAIAREYDGIIIGRLEVIDKDVLDRSKLKFIGVLAKGLSNIDLDAVKQRGVALFYTPEANISSVAEHTIALLLVLSKNIIKLDKSMREGHFNALRYSTIDVKGKTLGIIGAGAIAKEIIQRAKAFGMRILCYTPHPERHKELGVSFVSLETLLKTSDFISVNVPLTKETENLIGENELRLVKPTAYLINTARGNIINEKALIETLKNRTIAGAGLDVFDNEPQCNAALLTLDNVILTPHVGGVSREALQRMEEDIAHDILAFLDRKKPKYRVV